MALTKQQMHNRAQALNITLMPLSDDKLYQGKTHGEYIRSNSIPNAIISGTVFNADLREGLPMLDILDMPIEVAVMVTTNVKHQQAGGFSQQWYKRLLRERTRAAKLVLWLPLNDMKEARVYGLEKLGQGAQGKMVANLVDLLGLTEMLEAA